MTEEPAFNDDFRDMLAALIAEGADFVVVGAHALAVHGVPRATGDIDLFIRPTHENAERVMKALLRFGAPVSQHGLTATDLETPGNVYQIGLPPRRIDLLTSISGVDFDRAWADRLLVHRQGMELAVLGRECLIANKRASGREKDLLDVKLLERATRN